MSTNIPVKLNENGEQVMDDDNPDQQSGSKSKSTKRSTQFKRRSNNKSHNGPKPFHKPRQSHNQPSSTNDQVFLDAGQEGSFPQDPENTNLNNINAEIKHISGVIHALIEYHVNKYTQPTYSKDKAAAKKCMMDTRHHVGVLAAAYLRSAKHTTILPTNITQQLQSFSYHDLYIDGGCAGIINSFMPIQGSCQLNVVDVLHRIGLWFTLIDPLHQALNKGDTLKDEVLINYNSLLMLSADNYMIRALMEVQSVATIYTTCKSDITQTPLFKLDPTIHYTTVSQVVVPTFVFEQSSSTKSLTKGRIIYTQKVRSIKYASSMDIVNHGIRYVGQAPPVLGDVMARVNSTFKFWFGFTTIVQDHQPRMAIDAVMYMNPCTVTQPSHTKQPSIEKAVPSRTVSPMGSNENAPLVVQPQQTFNTTHVTLRACLTDGIKPGVNAYVKLRAPMAEVNTLVSNGLMTLKGDKIIQLNDQINVTQLGFDVIERSSVRPDNW